MSTDYTDPKYRFSTLWRYLTERLQDDDVTSLALTLALDPESLGGAGTTKQRRLQTLQTRMWQEYRFGELLEATHTLFPHLDLTEFDGPAAAPRLQPTPAVPINEKPANQTPPLSERDKEKEYVNFNIRIQPDYGQGYRIEASHSYDGGAETGPILRKLSIDESEFQDLFTYLQELIADANDAKSFGIKLREMIFPSPVWTLFNTLRSNVRREGKGVRIRLNIEPPELSRLPWEYCYDEESRLFFAKDLNTPLVRYIGRPYTPDDLESPNPLRILLIMATPKGLAELDTAKEEAKLREILGQVRGNADLEVLPHATPYLLQRTIATFEPHVVHFIGHGEFEGGVGAIMLETEEGKPQRYTAEQLADNLRSRGVKLVILNACETAAAAEGDAFMGVAPALVLADIPAVIAMQFSVPDALAIRFTQALYDYLSLGKPVDTAVTEMRLSAANGPDPEDRVLWAIPVLFMRAPNGILWQPTASNAINTAPGTASSGAAERGSINLSIGGSVRGNVVTASGITSGGNVTISGGTAPADNSSLGDQISRITREVDALLVKLSQDDARDVRNNLNESYNSATSANPDGRRITRKLNNVLEILEDMDVDENLLNLLEATIKRARTL